MIGNSYARLRTEFKKLDRDFPFKILHQNDMDSITHKVRNGDIYIHADVVQIK